MKKNSLLAILAFFVVPLLNCEVQNNEGSQKEPVEQAANADRQTENTPIETPTPHAEFVVPDGITYKPADEETKAKAKEAIKLAWAGGPDELGELFGDLIVCGPALWKQIMDAKELADFSILPLTVLVPITGGPDKGKTQQMAGGVFRSEEERAAFCTLLDRMREREFQIRLLTEEELIIYWAMIPYDIEEPIYVVETPSQRFLIDFSIEGMKDDSTGSMKVLWVDEMSSYK